MNDSSCGKVHKPGQQPLLGCLRHRLADRGFQTRAFILHPTALEAPPTPILGAASVHGILAGWRSQLQNGGAAAPAPDERTPVSGAVE